MAKRVLPIRDQFFDSLDDATQLLRLFDFLPDVFLYIKDVHGRFVGMNEPWVRMRGAATRDELIGKTDLELHPVYWAKQYQQEDRRVMESGRELPEQVWLVPDGSGGLSTFVSSKIPVKDRRGRCIGVAGVMYRIAVQRDDVPATPALDEAVQSMTRHFDRPLQISELAENAGLSVSQFNRRFKAKYQMTPSEYLRRVRIHEATRLLAETNLSIGEIALETGFYDQSHFHRVFRGVMKLSPSEFRRQ